MGNIAHYCQFVIDCPLVRGSCLRGATLQTLTTARLNWFADILITDVRFSLSYVMPYAGLLDRQTTPNRALLLNFKNPFPSIMRNSFSRALATTRAFTYLNHYGGSDFATSLSLESFSATAKSRRRRSSGSPARAVGGLRSVNCLQHKSAAEIRRLAEKVEASNDPKMIY